MSADSKSVAVLGIDAAWTAANPSGVALVTRSNGRPRVVRVEASFGAFVGASDDDAVANRAATLDDVIRTARGLADVPVVCIAMDIPLSTRPIRGRRAADQAISRAFGAMKCSTHSPGPDKPGPWGRALQKSAKEAGYTLQVAGDPPGLPQVRALIEVYPHPALLRLCGVGERLPYKSGFPEGVRRQEFAGIVERLGHEMDGIPTDRVVPPESATGLQWKACEDSLDALVCCWVALEYLSARAIPYGDGTAAIWVPSASRGR
jgi:predicted RNase H-like nuclease